MSKELNKLILETYDMQQTVKELNEQIEVNKSLLQKHFTEDKSLLKSKEAIVEDIKVQQIESAYINYNGNKLEKSLKANGKKELINEVISKKYQIIDIAAFIDLMKLTHLTPREFKKYIKVTRDVQKGAIQNLFAKGEILKEDLEGCFDSKIVKSIRFTKIKTPEGD